ncbi:tRNA (guanosine(46)-N7)-methyltransferase TrmB [Mycobacterium liflandii]|nr:tRNA (guanine46-N7-)-methyltransferase [Mycobacterium sp. 012931]ULL09134.1 tRNA (guanosine(46)-N7)-methyltransferase TrmB [Mycobacterium liflandii]GAQ34470.1 tRNA (guanine46-N7-)-methyltransferase [Mycobacterium pseudoshottsii JCM 15466]
MPAATTRRQLLGINLDQERLRPGFMRHDGPMHVQPGVGLQSDTSSSTGTGSGPADEPEAEKSAWGYLPPTAFRSRHSALSSIQQQTWERRWPQLGRQATAHSQPSARGHEPIDPIDARAWFGREAPVVLEIGCGSGTSTLAMAQAEPNVDVIAVEVYRRGLAQLLCAIDRADLQRINIRLIRGNGIDVLRDLIAPESLTGVRVFFPDPWPKARHHKRRLIQPSTVALIADRLLPGGVFHAATDHPGYAEHIIAAGDAEPALARVDPGVDSLPVSVVRPTTKYEMKAHNAGSSINELIWKKQR